MFVSDKLIFLEVPKCGTTYVRKALRTAIGGKTIEKHNTVPSGLRDSERLIVLSIRNPWDWYVSLWAYGCSGQGDLAQRLTRPGKRRVLGMGWRHDPKEAFRALLAPVSEGAEWERLYRSPEDSDAFREWIHRILDPSESRRVSRNWSALPMREFSGLLTYHYMRLSCTLKGQESALCRIEKTEDLPHFLEQHNHVDHVLKMESIQADLTDFLLSSQIPFRSEKHRYEFEKRGVTNQTDRKRSLKYYYDDASINLVANRERLVIERFGYLPPSSLTASKTH